MLLLGLGTGMILSSGAHIFSGDSVLAKSALGTQTPDSYLNIGDFAKKFLDASSVPNTLNSVDNQWGVGVSALQTAAPNGLTVSNVAGFLPNLVTTNTAAGGFLSIPISGVGSVLVNGAGFSAAITVSMAADQAGFSYAHQISLLIGPPILHRSCCTNLPVHRSERLQSD